MKHMKCSAHARVAALVLAAAVTSAAAAALAISDRSGGQRRIPVEATAPLGGVATLDGGAPLPPVPAIEDPELSRTDRANEHHG
ncbi:MAG TPA: hypothetical protein VM937_13185 [Burkholderiaceae bacterium]|jgi:hypothetical protein|nr:hypothetical protein [Burkholderiaceae bacterium]